MKMITTEMRPAMVMLIFIISNIIIMIIITIICVLLLLPVVPRKAVAEVSKIGNL